MTSALGMTHNDVGPNAIRDHRGGDIAVWAPLTADGNPGRRVASDCRRKAPWPHKATSRRAEQRFYLFGKRFFTPSAIALISV